MANRLKLVLQDLVDPVQSAFVPGRSIGDNILLAQELFHGYHRQRGESRCAMKVDLAKAYDSVDWEFLLATMQVMGIPSQFCQWVRVCVTTPMFSVRVNGELHGFFPGARGLRQGDPLSPYLFVLVMEVLHGIIAYHTRADAFRYHWHCERTQTAMLMFADDLLLFSHGDRDSVMVLRQCLDRFTDMSGLVASPQKSDCFVCCDDEALREELYRLSGFRRGQLPIRYLGIPLISTKLSYGDCRPLMDRVMSRVMSWRSRLLSFAGRLQLVLSVLGALYVYWASIFVLPRRVLGEVDRVLRAFLWSGSELNSRRAKVAWVDVCRPKEQGGLGIRPIFAWNTALVSKLIWRIVGGDRESLWLRWLHAYRIRGQCFWSLHLPYGCPWYWRKLIQLRPIVRPHLRWHIGDGRSVFLWLDPWHPSGILADVFPRRLVRETSIPIAARVSSIIQDASWAWPVGYSVELAALVGSMPHYFPRGGRDVLQWLPAESKMFSVQSAFSIVSSSVAPVSWAKLVWRASGIPAHSFICWLAVRERLSTLDRLNLYLQFPNRCFLCRASMESHSHLFFSCPYARRVVAFFRWRCQFQWPGLSWEQGVQWAASRWSGKRPWQVSSRLIFQALVYFIWRERNDRCFRDSSRSETQLAHLIYRAVWTRLSVLSFPRTLQSLALMRMWRLPDRCLR